MTGRVGNVIAITMLVLSIAFVAWLLWWGPAMIVRSFPHIPGLS